MIAPQRPAPSAEPLRIEHLHPRATRLERLAMRVGMWLLIWSTRPLPDQDRERSDFELDRERELRERSYLRNASLIRHF